MSEKKRKGDAQQSERPSKRPQNARVRVSHFAGPDVAKPVVGKCIYEQPTSKVFMDANESL